MIGGNKIGQIQKMNGVKRNSIGEPVPEWKGVMEITGWLDMVSGDSPRTNFNAKIQESSHVFLADYKEIPKDVTEENSRFIVDGDIYEIKLFDDPMEMHKQLEIFLKYTGGQ